MDNIRLNMELQTSYAFVQESPPLAPNAEISRIKQEKKLVRGYIQTGDVYHRQSVIRNKYKKLPQSDAACVQGGTNSLSILS